MDPPPQGGSRETTTGPDANDVANSFSTSISSRTMKRAMAIAAAAEFPGSTTVGFRVTDTLRNNTIDPHLYDALPSKVVQLQVKFTPTQVLIATLCVAASATLLQAFFLLPYLWQKIIDEDWELEWTVMWRGPWLLSRPPTLSLPDAPVVSAVSGSHHSLSDLVPHRFAGSRASLPILSWRLNRVFLRGVEQDANTLQRRNAVLFWDIADTHVSAPHYDNRAECMYSSLRIIAASAVNGDRRGMEPRLMVWTYFRWFITVLIAGVLSGSLMTLMLNASH
ncbi:phosphate-repressible phosphate permease [Colletotrichum graminicola M1.001]|uniref:Phosphate-repressible phosphate permease n=1 Tax=Colletotrichum graminicola (strain M1.001 / M2 / FGSC 10212) TaxID=645133 RepID=E3QWW0_COLGM|nr:phosphate-repressible phosphate permease [Colletotrichum graminicola M1.001]EFQ35348.1 phosphate-repressible phosphate permease [Colletotrichum graminicola M1.001]